jgi:hypothetical protein
VVPRLLAALVSAIAGIAIVYSFLPSQNSQPSLIPPNVSFALPGLTPRELANCQDIWAKLGSSSVLGFTSTIPPPQLDPFLESARQLAQAEVHRNEAVAVIDLGPYLRTCRSLESKHMWGPGSIG